jgi:type IV secretory pathway VirB4 component
MNNVFREYLDDFVVYYINDILIFAKNMEDHERHVRMVLKKLQEVELYAKLEKCEVH